MREGPRVRSGNVARRWARVAVGLIALGCGQLAAQSARSLVGEGNKAYEREQYDEAMGSYESAERLMPEAAEIWFNKGDALYKQGDFAAAMRAYEQAAVLSDDPKLNAWSKYNQGNAAFRQGMEQAQQNPGEAIKGLERGVELYRDALRSDESVEDARHNIEVARRAIERLRLMEQQQQQQNNQDQDQKDEEQQDQQQQQQGGEQNQDQEGDQEQQQQQQQGEDEQQQEQEQQQGRQPQQQQQGQQDEERKQQAEQARDILDEERENRRQRQIRAAVGSRPVEKDW